jgi:hypothetical protein
VELANGGAGVSPSKTARRVGTHLLAGPEHRAHSLMVAETIDDPADGFGG